MPKDGSGPRLDGLGRPLWLLLELTYRCPLKCAWCNNPLDFDRYRDELTTEEWKRVLREGRELGSLQLGFSGGEPMMRRDVEELVEYATGLGYYTNLITSGVGLEEGRLAALKAAGLNQIQLSLQSPDPALTDEMVGARVHALELDVARRIKKHGFPMVLNLPVCRQNIDHAEALRALAEDLGVDYVEFANIQYYNWAMLNRPALLPTRAQIERAEAAVQAARARLGNRMRSYFVVPDYYDGRPKACMNGWGAIHLTIAPDGTALPCQEARVIKGLTFPARQIYQYLHAVAPPPPKLRADVPGGVLDPGSCAGCHQKLNPVVVAQFAASAMGRPGVQNPRVAFPQTQIGCANCHGTNHDDIMASKGRVPEATCGACHQQIYKDHVLDAGHSYGPGPRGLGINWERNIGVPHYKQMPRKVMEMGCDPCHAQAGATDAKYWSEEQKKYVDTASLEVRNGCIACHTRHAFNLEEARKPEACYTCHMGPDHPNYQAYMSSKHGSIYAARGRGWDWTQPLAQAKWEAPTCAYYHMLYVGADGTRAASHNMTRKIIWAWACRRPSASCGTSRSRRRTRRSATRWSRCA